MSKQATHCFLLDNKLTETTMKVLLALAFLAMASAVPRPEVIPQPIVLPEAPAPFVAETKEQPASYADEILVADLAPANEGLNFEPILLNESPLVVKNQIPIDMPHPIVLNDPFLPVPIDHIHVPVMIDIRPLIVPPEVLAQVAEMLKKDSESQNVHATVDSVKIAEESPVANDASIDTVKVADFLRDMAEPFAPEVPQVAQPIVAQPEIEVVAPSAALIEESPLDVSELMYAPEIPQVVPAPEQPQLRLPLVMMPEYRNPMARDMEH